MIFSGQASLLDRSGSRKAKKRTPEPACVIVSNARLGKRDGLALMAVAILDQAGNTLAHLDAYGDSAANVHAASYPVTLSALVSGYRGGKVVVLPASLEGESVKLSLAKSKMAIKTELFTVSKPSTIYVT